jgi:hypothetical protein
MVYLRGGLERLASVHRQEIITTDTVYIPPKEASKAKNIIGGSDLCRRNPS